MPPKKSKRKGARPEAPKPEAFLLRPQIDVSNDPPQFYSNHAEINFTAHDFTISFGRMSARVNPDQLETLRASQILRVPADVQVVIPASLVIGLIRALSSTRDNYEDQYNIKLNEPPGGTSSNE